MSSSEEAGIVLDDLPAFASFSIDSSFPWQPKKTENGTDNRCGLRTLLNHVDESKSLRSILDWSLEYARCRSGSLYLLS